MKRFFCLLAALCAAGAVSAQYYHPGEVLEYRVSYKARLFPNTEVGHVVVATRLEEYNGRPVYTIDARGRTLPTYRWFYDLDDRYVVKADTTLRRPVRFESDLKEGDYTFWSRYDYDWDSMVIATRWQSRQNPPQTDSFELTDASLDAISLFFRMRSVDPDSFVEGEIGTLEMVLENKIRRINYRFEGRETKRIRNIGKFRTLRFVCQLGSTENYSFTDGSEFTMWISDDENKIPLYLESPVRVGSIQAYIHRVEGLKYPLSSRIR